MEETLDGRQGGLKEYALGRGVFRRPPDYDPHVDAIVRVQASMLRKRLASYYEHEGRESNLRIELPRGGYVPAFHESTPEAPLTAAGPLLPLANPARPHRWRTFLAGAAIGAVLTVGAYMLIGSHQSRPPIPAPVLWAAFFQPGTESIVSFGAPLFYAGGGIFLRDTRVNVDADEHIGRLSEIERILGEPIRPQEDVYSGIGDLIGTHEIIRWLESQNVKTRLANSHYLGHSDIAGKNLIVVSSARFQTLLKEMNLPNHFSFDSSPDGGFVIDHPIAGEQRSYRTMSGTGVDTSYAVLSLWPGGRSEFRVLYLSGITTWATQASAQYVVNPSKTRDLQARLDADPPEGPRGRKSPFFQVLLRVEGKNNLPRTATYVTHRYLPPA